MKAKIYKAFALVFLVAGLGIAGYILSQKTDTGGVVFFEDPTTLIFLVFPFIPAFVFSSIAMKCEKKFGQYIEETTQAKKETAAAPPASPPPPPKKKSK